MARLRFSPDASTDLDDIFVFSRERFGLDTANDYLDGLEHACERLIDFPEMGPVFPGIRPPFRFLTYRSHNVFYRFDGHEVLVVRIFHHAMNAAARLRS